jgi:hypothetical protein
MLITSSRVSTSLAYLYAKTAIKEATMASMEECTYGTSPRKLRCQF